MKNLLLSLAFLAIASPSWGLGVTAGQITTTKLAPASVTTPKLHVEALDGFTGQVLVHGVIGSSATASTVRPIFNMYGSGSSVNMRNWRMTADSNVNGTWELQYSNTADSAPSANTAIAVSNGGNVGIGVTAPASKLTIEGTGAASLATRASWLNIGGTGAESYTNGDYYGVGFGFDGSFPPALVGFNVTSSAGNTKGDIIMATRDVTTDSAPTERMRIMGSGNVGIGDTTPDTPLDIESSGSTALLGMTGSGTGGAYIFVEESGQKGWAIGMDDGSGIFKFREDSITGDVAMAIGTTGNVGIGTAVPASTLHVAGSAQIGTGASVSSFTTSGHILPAVVATQTIAAGNTIAADACGGIKTITAAGSVTTDTTNSITAATVATAGCCMDIYNISSQSITIDSNAKTILPGGVDLVLGANDVVKMCQRAFNSSWVSHGNSVNN